jgi:hypothetical protein
MITEGDRIIPIVISLLEKIAILEAIRKMD